jgi:hypothetical protein
MDLLFNKKEYKSYADLYREEGFQKLEGLPFLDIFIHKRNGIIAIRYHSDLEIDKVKALEIIAKTKPLFNESVRYGISDARVEGLNFTKEALKLFKAFPGKEEADKVAVLVNNLPTRMLANFFINVNKPVIPTRTFQSIEKATTWLLK